MQVTLRVTCLFYMFINFNLVINAKVRPAVNIVYSSILLFENKFLQNIKLYCYSLYIGFALKIIKPKDVAKQMSKFQ